MNVINGNALRCFHLITSIQIKLNTEERYFDCQSEKIIQLYIIESIRRINLAEAVYILVIDFAEIYFYEP